MRRVGWTLCCRDYSRAFGVFCYHREPSTQVDLGAVTRPCRVWLLAPAVLLWQDEVTSLCSPGVQVATSTNSLLGFLDHDRWVTWQGLQEPLFSGPSKYSPRQGHTHHSNLFFLTNQINQIIFFQLIVLVSHMYK